MTQPLLEVLDVTRDYGPTRALGGVTFAVMPGEMFGLLGPNGAGKSTLMALLAGLAAPTSGSIRLAGRPLDPRDRAARRLVGLVPQELAVYDDLSARENLHFFGSLYGLRGPELARKADEVLAAVALADRADDRVGTFSGGMKRRLNLGVAVVHGPRLLFLDEPTTGVDPQSRNHIFAEVRRLNAAGLTVVYTSHYMEEVQALCTHVGILDRGRVVACDTLPNLLRVLPAKLTLELDGASDDLGRRLAGVPGVTVLSLTPAAAELASADAGAAVPGVVRACDAAGVRLVGLHAHEANLERVFLHLTGRTLRD